MKFKKLISLSLAASMVMSAFTYPPAGAAEMDSSEILYSVEKSTSETASGTCGNNLTWVLDSTGTLTISGEGEMTDWRNSSYVPWYDYRSSITEVVIKDGVTSIGDKAFYSCDALTSITIPDSVTSIGNYAFAFCEALTSITIPDSVTSIGESVFADCDALTSITIPNSITSITVCAFQNCDSLTSITIPDSVTSIGGGAFQNCDSLTSITIPDCVTSIGDWAFSDCATLTSITIPDGVTSIGDRAFSSCDALTSITIPDSVTSIGECAFFYCDALTSINVSETNDYYASVDGVLFNKDMTTIIQYPAGKTDTEYIIPDSVTSIGYGAFSNCFALTSITIPDSVTSIGDWEFSYCDALTSITIPDSVTWIGEGTFAFCYALNSITIENPECGINDSESTISNRYSDGTYHFDGTIYGYEGSTAQTYAETYGRTFVSLGEAPTEIASGTCGENLTWVLDSNGTLTISGEGAMTDWSWSSISTGTDVQVSFSGEAPSWYDYKNEITKIVIEDGVTSVGSSAFIGCTNITDISFGSNVETLGRYAFSYCRGLTSVTLPDNIKTTEDNVFSDCSGLEAVVLSDSLTTISEDLFGGCTSLYRIAIPKSVTAIEEGAFRETAFTDLPVSENIVSIGSQAFSSCPYLTTVQIPANIISIGSAAFAKCSSLTDFTVDADNPVYSAVDGVLVSKDGTLLHHYPYGRTDTAYTIPDNIRIIGEYAFYNCSQLTSISIPESVSIIRSNAFNTCHGLTSLTLPDSITELNGSAFYYCINLSEINIPANVTNIAENTFYYCYSLPEITIPDSVTNIGSYAFYGCDGLVDISIPKSVKNIDRYAFANCEMLASITILNPECTIYNTDNVICNYYASSEGGYVYNGIISGYDNSTAQTYAETYARTFVSLGELPADVASGTCGENLTWAIDDEGIMTISGTGAMDDWASSLDVPWYDYQDTISKVIIENGVTTIGERAFYNCDSLAEISIPESVTSIKDYSFVSCSSLVDVVIPYNVKSVGSSAFNTTSLLSVTVLNPICEIAQLARTFNPDAVIYGYAGSTAQAYAETYSRAFIELDPELDYGMCGNSAYWSLSADGVLTISGTGEMYNYSISSLSYNSQYANISFSEAPPWYLYSDIITDVVINEGITSVGLNAFINMDSIKNVSLPDTIVSILHNSFFHCDSLSSVTLPMNTSAIGIDAFSLCNSLEAINVAEENSYYSSIDGVLFNKDASELLLYPCGKTDTVYTVPDTVSVIKSKSFYFIEKLTSLILPENVSMISSSAMYACYFDSVTIENPDCEIFDSSSTIYTDITIYGYEDSTAQAYADTYGNEFIIIGSEIPTTTTTVETITTTTTTTTASTAKSTTTTTTSSTAKTTTTTTTASTSAVTTTTTAETTPVSTTTKYIDIILKVGEISYVEGLEKYNGITKEDESGKKIYKINDGQITAIHPGEDLLDNYRITVINPYVSCLSDESMLASPNDSLEFTVHDFSEELMKKETFADFFCVVSNVVSGKHLSIFTTSYSDGKLTVTLLQRPEIVLDQYYIAFRHNNVLIELGELKIGEEPVILGDVDSDKSVNAVDSSMILREYAIAATGGSGTFTESQKKAADVNRDNAIDAVDASSVLAYYAYTATGGTKTFEEYLTQ